MNEFEKALENHIGKARLAQIQKIRVGLAGVGGLGSNCALFLVRSGFKRLKMVDFDVVDWSNLNRQFYFADQVGSKKVEALAQNLRRINPDLKLTLIDEKITAENAADIFVDCDFIVEALDTPESKRLLVETYYNAGKLLVCASGLAGWGRSDALRIKKLKTDVYLVGDLVSEVGAGTPAMGPKVGIAAAKQADILLSHGLDHPREEAEYV